MVFTTVNSIEFTFRKFRNMKMVIWHITTHFVVEGHHCALQETDCQTSLSSHEIITVRFDSL